MIRGTIYITCSRAALILSGFVLNVILGRWLGPEQFGVFGIINSIGTTIELILLSSLAKGVSKFIAENERSIRSIINGGLLIQAISGLFIFGVLFFGADLIASLLNDQEMAIYFRMLSLFIPIAGLAFVYESALNGIRYFGNQAVITIIFHITRLIGAIFFVYIGLSLKGAILGLIVADIVRLFIGRYFCKGLRAKGNYNMKSLVKFGFQTAMLSFTTILLVNIDIVAVKVLLKDGAFTGFYNATLTISRMPSFMVGALGVTLFPLIVKSISENNEELTKRYISQSVKYLLLFIIPMTFLISATSEGLISILYGEVYSASARSLSILIFGWAFLTLNMMFNMIILAGDKPYIAVIMGLFLIPFSIVLNLTLIPIMGIDGAAWAATVTNIVGCALAGGYVYIRFNAFVNFASAVRILLASIITYLIAIFYPAEGFMLFANYIFLSIVFFVLLVILGEITIDDIMNLKGSVFKTLKKEKVAV